MVRTATASGPVEQYFREHPNRTFSASLLMKACGLGSKAQVSGAISYLNSKARNGTGGLFIQAKKRGGPWHYDPQWRPGDIPPSRRTAKITKMPNAVDGEPVDKSFSLPGLPDKPADIGTVAHATMEQYNNMLDKLADPAPATESMVTLKVLGTLAETGEVLVAGSNEQGFDGSVWAMRRLV